MSDVPPHPPYPPYTSPPTGDPEPTPPPPSPGSRRSAARSWIVAGAVTAVIAVGAGVVLSRAGSDSASSASATGSASESTGGTASDQSGAAAGRTGMPGGTGTRGTIESIDGSTITLAAGDESGDTVTVTTDDETVVQETVEGAISDIEVGDTVMVQGETTDGTIAATSIRDQGAGELPGSGAFGTPPEGMERPADGELPEDMADRGSMTPPEGMELPEGMEPPTDGQAPGFGGRGTRGTVTAVSGSTVTVETSDGSTVTVTTTDETTVTVTRELAVADLEVGDTVSVQGETTDDTVAAAVISRGDLAGGMGGAFPGPPSGSADAGSDGSGD